MNYCVIKDTTKIIDGSDNPLELMLQNAQNAGFTADKVEILTQEQYDARKALEPQPTPQPTLEDYVLELEFRLMMLELGLN